MPTIVGVRFKPTGKTYYFDPCGIQFKRNEGAIVETSRGAEFAIVVIENKEVPDSQIVGELKPVKQKATQQDIMRHEQNMQRKAEVMRIVKDKIDEHGLDMHLKDMDFSYDNTKMTFYYSADDRVDFRELVKDLGATLRTRVELRQIGIRDETKMLGGLGSCGRPCCCSSFLNGFERVSIKMAKVQGLSLNPVNISGLCGRLMCCLKYENEHYVETTKLMPKLNDKVTTPDGEGKVEALDLLKRTVKVQFCDENGSTLFKVYDLADLGITKQNDEVVDDDDMLKDADLEALQDDLHLEEEKQPQKPQQEGRQNQKPKKPKNKDFGKKDLQKKEEKNFKKERQDKVANQNTTDEQTTENKQQNQKRPNKKHKRHKNKHHDAREKSSQATQQE